MPIILHDDGGRLNELVSGQSGLYWDSLAKGTVVFLQCVAKQEQCSIAVVAKGAPGHRQSRGNESKEKQQLKKARLVIETHNWNQDLSTFTQEKSRENK